MKKIYLKFFILMFLPLFLHAENKNFNENQEVKEFVDDLVKEHGFKKEHLEKLFSSVTLQKLSLKQYLSPKKKDNEIKKVKKNYGSWDRYEDMFLSQKRVKQGALFMKKNKKTLIKAYKEYGVQPEYITAIIGVESFYGQHSGKNPVFDTLATLAFEKNRRNNFFRKELKAFLIFAKNSNKNPKEIKGSWAGAIGMVQFMPSNFKKLAVDFNNDGIVDLNNDADAIGSVANYFKLSGWNKKIPVATRVSYAGERFDDLKTGIEHKYDRLKLKGIRPKYGRFNYASKVHLIKLDRKKYDELWYGTKNFFVITRYNKSSYYAMAVHKLAKEIKKLYKKI